jgi:hypothetical protein
MEVAKKVEVKRRQKMIQSGNNQAPYKFQLLINQWRGEENEKI